MFFLFTKDESLLANECCNAFISFRAVEILLEDNGNAMGQWEDAGKKKKKKQNQEEKVKNKSPCKLVIVYRKARMTRREM